MKTSMLSAILVVLLAIPGPARLQAAGTTAPQAGGTGGQPQTGFITSRGSDSIIVVEGSTFIPVPSTAAAPNPIPLAAGAGPNFILSVPSRNKVYVSNANGTLTVIDPVSRTVLSTIIAQSPAVGSAFAGMALAPDGNSIFVAGINSDPLLPAALAGVFQLDLNSEVLTFLPSAITAGNGGGIGVDVVPASAVGGSGNAVGRVYFSVPSSNLIGVVNFVGSSPTTIAPPAGTFGPTRMERSPDSSFLIVGCSSANVAGLRLIRIVPQSNGQTVDFIEVPFTAGTFGPTVGGVTFKSTVTTAPFTVYAGGTGPTTFFVRELTTGPTGTATDVTETLFFQAYGAQLTYDPVTNRLIASNDTGGSDFSVLDLNNTPPYGATSAIITGGLSVQNVAYAATTGPAVDYVNPSSGLASAPPQLLIQGSGFKSGAVAHLQANLKIGFEDIVATTTQVLDSKTIRATFAAADLLVNVPNNYDVAVVNPDGQQSVLREYFQTIPDAPPPLPAPPPPAPLPAVLPALVNGYAMISFPQYATVGDLRFALSAQVGPYNPAVYRLFMWNLDRYVEITGVHLDTDLMGRGLFAVSRLGPSVTLPSPDVNYYTTSPVRVVSLTPGWNLISYPYLGGSAGNLNSISISRFRDLSFQTSALSSGLIFPGLFEFDGVQYLGTTNMVPGKAYWIFNETSGPLYMEFQHNLGKGIGAPRPLSSAPPISPPAPPGVPLGENMGCGLLGLEGFVLFLAASGFRRLRSRRTLGA